MLTLFFFLTHAAAAAGGIVLGLILAVAGYRRKVRLHEPVLIDGVWYRLEPIDRGIIMPR